EKPLLQVWGYEWDQTQSAWEPLTTNARVNLRLEDNRLTIWSEDCKDVLGAITPDSDGEYHQMEPQCTCLITNKKTYGFRFEREDDEITFLNFLDDTVIDYRKIFPDRAIPSIPPPADQSGKPLMYVLNLVRTKHISGVRRGARVKAMAVASRHQWVHVFKPLLVLALEKFFLQPSEEVLATLYTSINAMDLGLMPRLCILERMILRASEDKSMFEEKFVELEERAMLRTQILNRARAAENGDVGGGAASPMMGGASAGGAGGLLQLRERSFSNSSSMSGAGLVGGSVGRTQTAVIGGKNKDRHFFETKVEHDGIRVPIRVPLTVFPEEIGDFSMIKLITTFSSPNAVNPPQSSSSSLQWRNGVPYHWHPHLDNGPNTHPIIILLDALLAEKRVLFLGYQRPAGEVANYVLAACAMAGGGGAVLRGFAERCFPYVSLAGLDGLLAVPGYIAGVTNPVFEEQTSWWDVLCNINTGKITISPKMEGCSSSSSTSSSNNSSSSSGTAERNKDSNPDEPPPKDKEKDWLKAGCWEGDTDLMQEVQAAIQSHMGEMYVRQKFHDHVKRVVEVAAAFEMETFGTTGIGLTSLNTGNADLGVGAFFADENAKKREITIMRNRTEGWRQSRCYLYYQKDFQQYLRRRAIRSIDTSHLIARLRSSSSLSEPVTVRIFLALQDALAAGTDDQINELLSLLPQSMGGLHPVAIGLYHPRWEVRRASTRIMGRIHGHKVGSKFIQHLNPFMRLTYDRATREFMAEDNGTLHSSSSMSIRSFGTLGSNSDHNVSPTLAMEKRHPSGSSQTSMGNSSPPRMVYTQDIGGETRLGTTSVVPGSVSPMGKGNAFAADNANAPVDLQYASQSSSSTQQPRPMRYDSSNVRKPRPLPELPSSPPSSSSPLSSPYPISAAVAERTNTAQSPQRHFGTVQTQTSHGLNLLMNGKGPLHADEQQLLPPARNFPLANEGGNRSPRPDEVLPAHLREETLPRNFGVRASRDMNWVVSPLVNGAPVGADGDPTGSPDTRNMRLQQGSAGMREDFFKSGTLPRVSTGSNFALAFETLLSPTDTDAPSLQPQSQRSASSAMQDSLTATNSNQPDTFAYVQDSLTGVPSLRRIAIEQAKRQQQQQQQQSAAANVADPLGPSTDGKNPGYHHRRRNSSAELLVDEANRAVETAKLMESQTSPTQQHQPQPLQPQQPYSPPKALPRRLDDINSILYNDLGNSSNIKRMSSLKSRRSHDSLADVISVNRRFSALYRDLVNDAVPDELGAPLEIQGPESPISESSVSTKDTSMAAGSAPLVPVPASGAAGGMVGYSMERTNIVPQDSLSLPQPKQSNLGKRVSGQSFQSASTGSGAGQWGTGTMGSDMGGNTYGTRSSSLSAGRNSRSNSPTRSLDLPGTQFDSASSNGPPTLGGSGSHHKRSGSAHSFSSAGGFSSLSSSSSTNRSNGGNFPWTKDAKESKSESSSKDKSRGLFDVFWGRKDKDKDKQKNRLLGGVTNAKEAASTNPAANSQIIQKMIAAQAQKQLQLKSKLTELQRRDEEVAAAQKISGDDHTDILMPWAGRAEPPVSSVLGSLGQKPPPVAAPILKAPPLGRGNGGVNGKWKIADETSGDQVTPNGFGSAPGGMVTAMEDAPTDYNPTPPPRLQSSKSQEFLDLAAKIVVTTPAQNNEPTHQSNPIPIPTTISPSFNHLSDVVFKKLSPSPKLSASPSRTPKSTASSDHDLDSEVAIVEEEIEVMEEFVEMYTAGELMEVVEEVEFASPMPSRYPSPELRI
ncbi:hypothetical protein HK102_011299, partial [Quaeritorhiza haematococci]